MLTLFIQERNPLDWLSYASGRVVFIPLGKLNEEDTTDRYRKR